MYIEFDKNYLEDLFKEGKTKDKKHRFQPQIIRDYQKVVMILASVNQPEDLYPFKSLHFEALHGDKEGLNSVRITLQYRLEFYIRIENHEQIINICRLTEISNHYK